MNKPISTKMHGVLDYYTAPTLMALPRIMGWGKKVTNLLTVAGLGMMGYSFITRYELGLLKLLPMPGHLTIDVIAGAGLAASPFVLLDESERTPLKTAVLVGFGLYEIIVAPLTQTESPATDTDQGFVSRVRELVTSTT
jgi:hypothetical protein